MAKIKPATETKKLNKLKNIRDNKVIGKVEKRNKLSSRTRKGRKIRKKQERQPTGVVYLSHIPHGFYEEQIENYFSQFGKVTAVSVPRSKSGRAKGYAFIEYRHPEIAMIAAETMDNYLMFNRLLKAKYIPPEQQKPRLFYVAKSALENHKTAADKAALAVKHNRKLKNRHLKLSLEAKHARKLLKKKKSLMKHAEKVGLNNDFVVEEANLQAVFQRKREHEASKDNIETESETGDRTDSSEEQLSSSEDFEDTDKKKSKAQKRLVKSEVTAFNKKLPSSAIKVLAKASKKKKSLKVVMEVDKNEKRSKITRGQTSSQTLNSTPPPKKMRHRNLKRMLSAQI